MTHPQSAPGKTRRSLDLLLGLMALALAALPSCNNGNGNGIRFIDAQLFVSNNGAGNAGDIDRFNQVLTQAGTFTSMGNEGVVFDAAGNLYHASDAMMPGSIFVINGAQNRFVNGPFAFDANRDRQINGANTGLMAPKGMDLADFDGFLFVADFGAGNLKVFASTAAGNATPVAVITFAAPPWDAAYDEAGDRLFVALTNGTIAALDAAVANAFTGTPRVIVPADALGQQISTNLHGIAYHAPTNRLVVTDVGSAANPSDGSIYVMSNPAANGVQVPARRISGPDSRLGNPVDLILVGRDAYVAEKSNDLILGYDNILFGASGDIAADISVAETKPESLAPRVPNPIFAPDVTDVDDALTIIDFIGTTSNPGGADPADGEFALLSPDLGATANTFDTNVSVENVTFDGLGDGFFTFDDGTNMNGGILVVNRADRQRGDPDVAVTDRMITGPGTTLVSPKGLDIAGSLGLILVAENNATTPSVTAFSVSANGNAAPVFSINLTATGRPWDLDYDPASDRLFVALTNGLVAVIDQLGVLQGAAVVNRTITPTNGTAQVSINLHGIIYVATSDALILSDVGSAANPSDGQLFVIQGAAAASGMTAAGVIIGGAATLLGNPVDIAFDGDDLYVAEKSNNAILRFDDILVSAGGNVAPDLMAPRTGPESVALVPSYLSPASSFGDGGGF